RNVGMPLSAEIPAPVNTTTWRADASVLVRAVGTSSGDRMGIGSFDIAYQGWMCRLTHAACPQIAGICRPETVPWSTRIVWAWLTRRTIFLTTEHGLPVCAALPE